jgi:hypothetical protein
MRACLERWRVDGEGAWLARAEAVARTTLDTFGDFRQQPPSFNAMCFEHLRVVAYAVRARALHDEVQARVHDYADWLWTTCRDPDRGVFHVAGRRGPAQLEDQGAALHVFALAD